MWKPGLTLPFTSLTFLLLALTSPGTWGVALFFGSVTVNPPFRPLLRSPSLYLSLHSNRVYCEQEPSSQLQLTTHKLGVIVMRTLSITNSVKKRSKTRFGRTTCGGTKTKQRAKVRTKLTSTELIWWATRAESNPLRGLAPAASYLQHSWSVYNPVDMRAASDSIATRSRGELCMRALCSQDKG